MMQRLPFFLQLAAVACLVGAVVLPSGEAAVEPQASSPVQLAQAKTDSEKSASDRSASDKIAAPKAADEATPSKPKQKPKPAAPASEPAHATAAHGPIVYWSLIFVFVLSTFIGLGVVGRVSRLLHTPLMSLTNAISAIAVVGAIIVTGTEGYPPFIRFLGAVALFASMTNIVSGFMITERMLKMFKQTREGGQP
jgi:H+-translocating NAD(P) transhydrogenase subunit alpha